MGGTVEVFYFVPVGAVIAWLQPPGAGLPHGFAYCDGSEVDDPESPFNGMTTPDMRSRYILGAGGQGYVASGTLTGDTGLNTGGWQNGAISTSPTQVTSSQDNTQNCFMHDGSATTSDYSFDVNKHTESKYDTDGNHHHVVNVGAINVPAPGSIALTYLLRIK